MVHSLSSYQTDRPPASINGPQSLVIYDLMNSWLISLGFLQLPQISGAVYISGLSYASKGKLVTLAKY